MTGQTAVGVVNGDLVVEPFRVPAMESVPAVAGVDRRPAAPEVFVGRTDELAQLDAAVADSGRAVVVAVHGLGGVGKSTLASRFAERQTDRFSPVWWVVADSPGAIDTGMADLAEALVQDTAGLPLEHRAALGVRWLATHNGWLLVLDNLTAPADAAELLERVHTGTIVITSRQGTGWRGITTVALDVLTPQQAVELLTRIIRTDWPEADLSNADALCEELGWLPLAVEQAGAYIGQARITPAAYLDLLGRYPDRMFAAAGEGGDAQRTVARVWRVTLNRLADTPLAGSLLRQLAWYAPDEIPRRFVAAAGEEPDVLDALGRLAAHSMISLTEDTISVHRLVQAITRTPDPSLQDPHRHPDDVTAALHEATATLNKALDGLDSDTPENWPAFLEFLPHAQVLLDRASPDSDSTTTCNLLNQLGRYLQGQGGITTAITHLTRATRNLNRLSGPDHPDTLASRNNLASAYEAAGNLTQAITLYEANLTDSERILGPDHPDTLTARNNLAYAYKAAGNLTQAITLYEANLTDSERIL
ncbi:tetratricopeptide repeat protein, partial [Actinosynnema pretiosum]|uniref:tetratricopeptide repeat protein n=1 Tax=Actinosynnema pretiosum TaxID=42197 RepID=UPI0031CFBA7A